MMLNIIFQILEWYFHIPYYVPFGYLLPVEERVTRDALQLYTIQCQKVLGK